MNIDYKDVILKYGEFPPSLSHLATQKSFFKNTHGLVAYELIGEHMVLAGEPIVWGEFQDFFLDLRLQCKSQGLKLCGYYVSEKFKERLENQGLRFVPCGTTSLIDLQKWSLTGKSSSEVRRALNHGQRGSLEVLEIDSTDLSDGLQAQVQNCYKAWRSKKGIINIKFLLDSHLPNVNKWQDYERVFFCFENSRLVSYVSWLPYGDRGMYLNQMIQHPEGHRFALDLAIARSILKFKQEAYRELSFGLNPFQHLENKLGFEGFLNLSQKLIPGYSSEGLAYYKSKFGITSEEPRYLFWDSDANSVGVVMALTRASFEIYRERVSEL